MNMRIGLPFSCNFVGKSWYVLVMSMIRYMLWAIQVTDKLLINSARAAYRVRVIRDKAVKIQKRSCQKWS